VLGSPQKETSSVTSISPKPDLFVLISITRRYAESQLTKWEVHPGWGLGWGEFGNRLGAGLPLRIRRGQMCADGRARR
jgi:hypothetical protein